MTELPDWLAREELPTGTFGDAPGAAARLRQHREPAPDPLALEHQDELLAALDAHPAPTRHLYAVPDDTTAA